MKCFRCSFLPSLLAFSFSSPNQPKSATRPRMSATHSSTFFLHFNSIYLHTVPQYLGCLAEVLLLSLAFQLNLLSLAFQLILLSLAFQFNLLPHTSTFPPSVCIHPRHPPPPAHTVQHTPSKHWSSGPLTAEKRPNGYQHFVYGPINLLNRFSFIAM